MAWGTNGLSDLLAQQVPVVAFGEDRAFEAFAMALEVHNRITNEIIADLADPTTDNLRRYGGPASMIMQKVDEYARVDAQKVPAGANIGFPLDPYQISLQWTRWYMEKAMVSELAAQFIAAQDADIKNLQSLLKQAVFSPTNYSFVDKYDKGLLLPVKAFLNADGAVVPLGPNGEVFNAATHTHYIGCGTANAPTAGEVKALIETVIEHYATGESFLFLNRAQEPIVRGFTADFFPFYDAAVTVALTAQRGDAALDRTALYNRAIGRLNSCEVWVKPWVPAGYMFTWMRGAPKPLVMRTPLGAGGGGLRIMAANEMFPLRAETMQREIGVGVWNRSNGAILDATTGGGTFTVPTAQQLAVV